MDIEFNLDGVLLLQLVVATVLPLIVGLVTTRVVSPGVKAILLAFLALLTALGAEALAAAEAGVTYDLGRGLFLALASFLIAVGMHYGLWKPTTLSAQVQDVHATTLIGR